MGVAGEYVDLLAGLPQVPEQVVNLAASLNTRGRVAHAVAHTFASGQSFVHAYHDSRDRLRLPIFGESSSYPGHLRRVERVTAAVIQRNEIDRAVGPIHHPVVVRVHGGALFVIRALGAEARTAQILLK